MSDCLFCKIVNGEIPGDIVYQDDTVLVFKDLYPKAETHLLLIPKKHYIDLPDIAEKDSECLSYMMQIIPKIVKQQNLNNGFRTIINTGKGGGQVIFHLHAHILAGKDLPGF
jgi:histidine triad (HIT) family protein